MQDGLLSGGYQLFVCSTDGHEEQERNFLTDSLQRRVDGVALAAFSTTVKMLTLVLRETSRSSRSARPSDTARWTV